MVYKKLIESNITKFSLTRLPKLLKSNNTNTVSFYSSRGELIVKNFSEVDKDVQKVIEKQNRHFKNTDKHSLQVLIMGKPSYYWLIAALACFYQGFEVISFPETLNDYESQNCLVDIDFSFCFLDENFVDFSMYKNVPKLLLNEELIKNDKESSNSFYDVIPQPNVIAFTSGTTSALKLKAFHINTKSTECFFNSFTSIYSLTHNDKWAVCHSFSHIVHFEYVLGGLFWGLNLIIAEPVQILFDCKKLKPNVLVTVPAVYQQLVSFIRAKIPSKGERAKELEEYFKQDITEENITKFRNHLIPEVADIIGNQFKMMLIGTAPSSLDLKKFLILCGLPIYEGYGMSETNMLTCNTPDEYKLGSAGVAWPGVKIRIEDDQLKVQLDFKRSYRYINASTTENNEVFEENGWINTGDISRIDDNFIFITGRSKDTIITDRGKNINPNPIEQTIKFRLGAEHVVLYGDNRPFVIAIISFSPDKVINKDFIDNEISKLNKGLGLHERIKNLVILQEDFSIENGLITRSGKVRRNLVWKKYMKEIEECYV